MNKVLIIEDNDDNMALITFILEKEGYGIIKAENGVKGIALAKGDRSSFIILDIQLPDMNGIEVLRAIRDSEINGDIPIIAMTSYAMSGDKERLLKAGCNGYIEKPIDPATVMDQINEIIGG